MTKKMTTIRVLFSGLLILTLLALLTPTSSLQQRIQVKAPAVGNLLPTTTPKEAGAPTNKQQVIDTYGKLRLDFEANQGQIDSSGAFLSNGQGVRQAASSTSAAGRQAEIPPEVRQLMEAKRYEIRANQSTTATGAYQAFNPAHGMRASFSGKGFSVAPLTSSAKPWHWGMSLRDYGYGARLQPVRKANLVATGNRIEYRRGNLIEWYVNRAEGLEQGFTILERPASWLDREPLRLRLELSGRLNPRVNAEKNEITLVDDSGSQVLAYDHLVVTDRAGRELPSHFEVSGGVVSIVVADAEALYPMTIDPTLTQHAYLKASNTGVGDFFGSSVAISGDTAVVGAYAEASNATGVNGDQSDNSQRESGAVYVFVRSGETWSQQAYLKASNNDGPFGPNVGDRFGQVVAISGDTIIVGAPFEDSNATGVNGDQSNNLAQDSGAAYVFERSNGTWSQQAYLKASNNGNGFVNNDYFGQTVAVSGDTVVVGAPEEDSDALGVNGNQGNNSRSDSGAAYVFVRTGGSWSQQAYLKASNGDNQDYFGRSVGVSGDSVVVGARNESSNATGVNGDQGNNSASASGAAYLFVRSGAVWSQEAYLKASNTGSADFFGESVAISGDTVVVGAADEDSNAIGVDGNQNDNSADAAGAAYVFERTAGVWSQQAYLKASNTEAGDAFGGQVAVSGNMVVVGARFEDSNATCAAGNQSSNSAEQAGAAYVFVRGGLTWGQQTYLKASNTQGVDLFGESVAISGDTVVVGAAFEGSNATGVNGDQSNNSARASGAVYVYGPLNQSPVARCRNVVVSANSACTASVSIDNGSSDPDCDAFTLTQSPPGPYPLGDTTVTLTVTDSNGASTSCSSVVTVRDNTPPVPNLATLPTITGACSATVTAPTATDNCTVQVTGTTTDPTIYNSQGTFIVHWTYNDGNGNTSTQTQTVVVDDTTAPTPNVTSLPTVNGACSATVTAPTATDNCAGQITGTTTNPTSYNNQGTFIVHWTYDDGHGNTSMQTQTVVVNDTTPPAITAAPARAYVANHGANNVSVINTATNGVMATVLVGSSPFGMAISPNGTRAYVTNETSNNVSVIDTATNTVVATIPVGSHPFGVAITPDGTRAYVTNYSSNSVSLINTTTNTVITTVPVGSSPLWVAITPDGTRAYVTNALSHNVSVIDTATNTVVATITVPSAALPQWVAITPDGSRAYMSVDDSMIVSVIDTMTNTVVASVPVGNNPRALAITPDGTRAYVANLGSNTVSVINTTTNSVVATVAVGSRPAGVGTTPDGTRVYVTNVTSDNVSVIDTATNVVIAAVTVGSGPLGLAITPAPTTGSIVNFANGSCQAAIPNVIPAYSASDNCSGTVTLTQTPVAGALVGIGSHNITVTATDPAGNTSTVTTTFTVTDNTPPAPDVTTLPTVTAECYASISGPPTATDNCAGHITGTTTDPTSYNSPGTFTIHWSYADGHGNTSTQTQTVIVQSATTASAGPDQAFCETTMATLAGNAPTAGTGTWTVLNGTATVLDPHNPAAVATNLSYGANVFRWTFSNGSCSSADDVIISRNSCPTDVALFSNRDSFLRSGADDTNEGANERLRIQNSGDNRAVVAFNLTGVSTTGLQSATLVLNIAENSNNWGSNGRLVDVHRLLVDWTEGNGRNDVMVGAGPEFRGTGAGVTWHCGHDTNIVNQVANCSPHWNGGSYAAATAPSVLHTNGLLGQVSWDVTADVLAGANFGWVIRKQNEGQNGQVRYYSREGAALAGNANLAPRLVLVYSQ